MTVRSSEIDQHIGWLRQFIQGMTPENWRDMQLRADRQLDQLERAVGEKPYESEMEREHGPDLIRER